MFAHLFVNAFIIDSAVPAMISINYDFNEALVAHVTDPKEVCYKLYQYAKTHSDKNPVFFKVQDELFNPILQEYGEQLRLDHEAYRVIIEHNYVYDLFCENPQHPAFLQNRFKLIPKEKWTLSTRQIPINPGVLPYELLVNHIHTDPYATKVYTQMMTDYNSGLGFQQSFGIALDKKPYTDLTDFILDKHNNMAYNDEFLFLFFNKRLMFHLMSTKYTIDGLNI